MEQLKIDMCQYEFAVMFEWLIDNFGYGAWSFADFELYNSRWGWEGNTNDTTMYFKTLEDAVLFKLTWLND